MPRLALASFVSCCLLAGPAMAVAPVVVHHTGYLLSAADAPVTNPSVSMAFRVADALSGGSVVWSGACPVSVTAGYYEVLLGEACGSQVLDTSHLPPGAPRYLEVEVGGVVLAPRLRLSAVPAAVEALHASEADQLSSACVGCVGGAQLEAVGTPGVQLPRVTTDASGRVVSSAALVPGDLPGLPASQITSGRLDVARLPTGAVRADGARLQVDANGLVTQVVADTISGSLAGTQLAPNSVTRAQLERAGTTGEVLTSQGTGADPIWAPLPSLTLPLSPTQGGTGATTLPSGSVLLGGGSASVTGLAPGAAGNVLVSDGTQWTSAAPPSGSRFGGTGADGALAISSGVTTIDLAGAALVVKNYTSIAITGTGQLKFTNPHAAGTSIILKSQGNVTITSTTVPSLDASALGAAGGTGATGSSGNGPGGGGGSTAGFVLDDNGHGGGGGNGGGQGTCFSAPTSVAGGVVYGNRNFYASSANSVTLTRTVFLAPGSGGAGGGAGGRGPGGCGANACNGGNGGNGGRGGGALLVEVGEFLQFTGTISVAGENGSAGGAPCGGNGSLATNSASGGGGGGGSGGMAVVLYNKLTSNTGTVNVNGGSGAGGSGFSWVNCNNACPGTGGGGAGGFGGAGGTGQISSGNNIGGPGGAGGSGLQTIVQNVMF